MVTENTYQDLCRLLGAWANGGAPELDAPDFDALYEAASKHLLSAAACAALESVGLMDACPALTEKERETLDRVESSGVYGTTANRVHSWLQSMQGDGGVVTARTKARYLFWRVFPDREWYRANAPFVYRHRWTVPFFWAYRLCRGVLKGRRSLREVGIVCARRE